MVALPARLSKCTVYGVYCRPSGMGISYTTASEPRRLAVTAAGPLAALALDLAVMAAIVLGPGIIWSAAGIDQLRLSAFAGVAALAAFQAVCLTPLARDGRNIATALRAIVRKLRQPLLAPVLIVAACLVGAVTRQQRSLFPARRPPQQLINLEGGPWVARQFGIALLWFAGLYAPPLVTALWIGLPPWTVWSAWATAGASAFAVSALAGWILPFPLDNAPGQLLASVATVSAAGAVGAFAVDVSSRSPLLSLALCLCALIVSAGAAVAAEQRRWAAG